MHHCQGEAAVARSIGVRAMNSRDATIRCSLCCGENEPPPPGQARGIKCIVGQSAFCCILPRTFLPIFPYMYLLALLGAYTILPPPLASEHFLYGIWHWWYTANECTGVRLWVALPTHRAAVLAGLSPLPSPGTDG